ncbi:TfoX/Sxy family DNA transformation protein [Vibrio sp. Hal054]|uniref:TfoX/Sxy family DNA transformation protein n=1 Tax=Vibrio sp. Hal054 TaxID=3035158 RepID=UPI00301D5419
MKPIESISALQKVDGSEFVDIKYRSMFGTIGVFEGDTTFALATSRGIFLAARESLKQHCIAAGYDNYTYYKSKGGVSHAVQANYFHIPQEIVANPVEFHRLCVLALKEVKQAQEAKKKALTIRELPNMSRKYERMLKQVGIASAEELQESDAQEVFVKVKERFTHIADDFLLKLEGAIKGIHYSVISA